MKFRVAAALLFTASLALSAQTPPPPAKRLPPAGVAIPADARTELAAGAAALRDEIDGMALELAAARDLGPKILPDVEIFHKAVDWALRYDEFFDAKQVAIARRLLAEGHARLEQLRVGAAPWLEADGLIVRGYRSKIDGSVQPYGLVVPKSLGPAPHPLMVWLLGRGDKRSELAFLAEREGGPPQLAPSNTIILIPYGRFCNATKFAGEMDVFEAMDAVRTNYSIDPDRILVAGFSMGGASTWHLATHHAGLWCGASPGAGFAETAIYTKALEPGKEPRTWWEQKLWHWTNATDYAGNLFNCPTIAYSGEIDPQKQSADLMEQAMAVEGLKLERLIGPQTAHKYHPETKEVLTTRLNQLIAKGRDPLPAEVKLTTYTLRYPGESWVRVAGLERHWERADVDARVEGNTLFVKTHNVTALQFVWPEDINTGIGRAIIDGQELSEQELTPYMVRERGQWHSEAAPQDSSRPPSAVTKSIGLTGPIDDAFMSSFLFVRPTGRPLNAKLGQWVDGELAHAKKMWRDIFRGDAPIKDDRAVDADDIYNANLVLWGDPSSNRVLAQILDRLPIKWNGRQIEFRGKTYDAAVHAPIFIFPNPLNTWRYVVINSGIDFRDEAYGTNSLQTPKLPDYAIVDLREAPGPRWPGKIVDAGFFDESWK